tara:strand:- start:15834 stop:16340 length:507 start_codon:yes stop_codon:yes gene_type:complete
MTELKIPEKYIPKFLADKDKKKQKGYIKKSRKLYKEGKYYERPKVKSYKNKPSGHLEKVRNLYGFDPLIVNKELEKQTGCDEEGLEKILSKGRGAYYSSGSRPNQTAESWAVARLASAITGGPASAYDYHVLEEHCKKDSIALKLAKKTCKKLNKSCGKNKTIKNKKK